MLGDPWSCYCLYLEIKYGLRQSVWVPSWQGVDLWWLILCVNLTRPEGAQIIWSNILLGVSVRVVLDESNICNGRLGKADCPPHGGWVSSNQLKASVDQKGWGRRDFLPAWLPLSWDINYFSCFQMLNWNIGSSLVSGLREFRLELCHWLFWVSSIANCRSQDLSAPVIVWANSL